MLLYISHFVIAEENLWFDKVHPYEVVRTAVCYWIQTQMFAAAGADQAYVKAVKMMEGLSDANCDGPGDRTNFTCVGIHELDEIAVGRASLDEALEEPYGLDVGTLKYGDNAPVVPSRNVLSLFRVST